MDDRTITKEEDINAPVSWLCVDCSFNTAPGMSTRAEIYKAMVVDGKEELPQTIDANSEVYVVRNAVWAQARMKPFGGCLCIGCLEARLSRKLAPNDFLRGHGFNDPCVPGTKRLLERRGRPR
jgi:hypothetical protein